MQHTTNLSVAALAFVLMGQSSIAQLNPEARLNYSKTKQFEGAAHQHTPPSSAGARAAFYTEDFSGGTIPAGWTNVDELTPAIEDPVFFEWSNDPDDVDAASGSFPEIGTFLATGATDGYLWANSDRGLTVAPLTEHLTRLTTSAIDCSGQPTVLFSMKSTIGVFNNDANEFAKLRVSTDLSTWVDFFPFPCLEAGSPTPPCSRFSANPTEVAVNISSVAANQPTVYLQFEWQGDWEYYWAIDDLELSPLPDEEIAMSLGYVSTTGLGEEYGRVPTSQLPATINIGAEVYNFGALDQTNVEVGITFTDAGENEVFATNTMIGTMLSQDTVVTSEDVALPNLPLGLYTGTYTLTSDQIGTDADPSNNARSRSFEVTEHVYSLDNFGNYPDGVVETFTPTGTTTFEDNSEDVKLMTMYYINTPITVTGIEVGIDANSDPGSSILVSILDTVDVLSSPSVVTLTLAESDFYLLTQADIDAGKVTIEFIQPVTLPVNAYYAVASLYADGDNHVYVIDDETVPQPTLASVLWIPFDPEANQNLYGGNGTAWAVRLTSDPTISVDEHHELLGLSIYPNPTHGVLRIVNANTEPMTVDVTNALGELVLSTRFTGRTTLDLGHCAHGVYAVRISDGRRTKVERVVLN